MRKLFDASRDRKSEEVENWGSWSVKFRVFTSQVGIFEEEEKGFFLSFWDFSIKLFLFKLRSFFDENFVKVFPSKIIKFF